MKKLVKESLSEHLNESYYEDVVWSLINDFGAEEDEARKITRTFSDKLQYSQDDGWDAYEMAEYLYDMI